MASIDKNMIEQFSFPEKIPLKQRINNLIDRSAHVNKVFYYDKVNQYYNDLKLRMTDNTAIYRIDDSGVAMMAWNIYPTLNANMGTFCDQVPLVLDSFEIRKLSPHDCLALQGFLKSFKFPGIPINEIYKQLKNIVCVPVVVRIAREIGRVLTPSRLEEISMTCIFLNMHFQISGLCANCSRLTCVVALFFVFS